jgi:hypothetical protein
MRRDAQIRQERRGWTMDLNLLSEVRILGRGRGQGIRKLPLIVANLSIVNHTNSFTVSEPGLSRDLYQVKFKGVVIHIDLKK